MGKKDKYRKIKGVKNCVVEDINANLDCDVVIRNIISSENDCFGVMYLEHCYECRDCMNAVKYFGEVMQLNEACKLVQYRVVKKLNLTNDVRFYNLREVLKLVNMGLSPTSILYRMRIINENKTLNQIQIMIMNYLTRIVNRSKPVFNFEKCGVSMNKVVKYLKLFRMIRKDKSKL